MNTAAQNESSNARAIINEEGLSVSGANISVKVDVEVSEALTGLKALQREAKEATKALRELEARTEGKRYNDDVNVLLYSKHEGSSFGDMQMVTTNGDHLEEVLSRLRYDGYRIFYVLKPAFVIDDFLKK